MTTVWYSCAPRMQVDNVGSRVRNLWRSLSLDGQLGFEALGGKDRDATLAQGDAKPFLLVNRDGGEAAERGLGLLANPEATQEIADEEVRRIVDEAENRTA
jgi:hypothetical protein